MGHAPELLQAEETGRALDVMNGAKGAVERVPSGRIPLERDEVALESLDVLPTLDNEFVKELVRFVHGGSRVCKASATLRPFAAARCCADLPGNSRCRSSIRRVE